MKPHTSERGEEPHTKGGHPRMFPPDFVKQDGLTPWERFERIAAKVFSVRKSDIDPHKPVRPRKAKRA